MIALITPGDPLDHPGVTASISRVTIRTKKAGREARLFRVVA
ncbi:hypothetical protein X743_26160 [Mesorhizobium sp. LNHC252B00]|nr:hypothetical protein X743_26160 [Mesorhizobium sp. LNHC252B00]